MKLLIVTQSVDKNDLYLGFFHRWIEELSKNFPQLTVVCLREGEHDFPSHVRVFSLGKEHGKVSRLMYVWRFVRLAWRLRHSYEAAFVHMNQEYVLLAGWLWRLAGKRVYMWRNHYAGSWLTDLAASFCTKVFCTSRYSYTAKYKKTVFMPVGVDTSIYAPVQEIERKSRSVLFYARMSPSKRPDMLIGALSALHQKGVEFTASFYGTPLPQDEAYLEGLKSRSRELGLGEQVQFYPGQAHAEGPAIFSAHEIFVNLGASGMYDKMIFEAAACGCLVLAASEDYRTIADPRLGFDGTQNDLAGRIAALLELPQNEKESLRTIEGELASLNSLNQLAQRFAVELQQTR